MFFKLRGGDKMKKTIFFLLLAVLITLFATSQIYAAEYQQQACYIYKQNGVNQWKHCQTSRFNWNNVMVKVKCVSGYPVGTFTRLTGSWTSTLDSKGCNFWVWATTGNTWHTFKIYQAGVYKCKSKITQSVTGSYPGIFAQRWS